MSLPHKSFLELVRFNVPYIIQFKCEMYETKKTLQWEISRSNILQINTLDSEVSVSYRKWNIGEIPEWFSQCKN